MKVGDVLAEGGLIPFIPRSSATGNLVGKSENHRFSESDFDAERPDDTAAACCAEFHFDDEKVIAFLVSTK